MALNLMKMGGHLARMPPKVNDDQDEMFIIIDDEDGV